MKKRKKVQVVIKNNNGNISIHYFARKPTKKEEAVLNKYGVSLCSVNTIN
jgi:hypothetical protein